MPLARFAASAALFFFSESKGSSTFRQDRVGDDSAGGLRLRRRAGGLVCDVGTAVEGWVCRCEREARVNGKSQSERRELGLFNFGRVDTGGLVV